LRSAGIVARSLRKDCLQFNQHAVQPARKATTMSTIWEMADTVRAEEAQLENTIRANTMIACALVAGERPIDVRDRAQLELWCRRLGTTRMQLYRAVAHVGPSPSAVRRFLSARFLRTRLHA
jgi:hypothetical protein